MKKFWTLAALLSLTVFATAGCDKSPADKQADADKAKIQANADATKKGVQADADANKTKEDAAAKRTDDYLSLIHI